MSKRQEPKKQIVYPIGAIIHPKQKTIWLLCLFLIFLSGCTPSSTAMEASPLSLLPTLIVSPSPTNNCLTIPGPIEIYSLLTSHLPDSMRFAIYLPPCYPENPNIRYPVLYLFHGQTYDEMQWINLGASEMMNRLIFSGEISPFIIVMPNDPSWKQPTEYSFVEAVSEDLIPYVDEYFRTLPDRQYRAVGGLSRGAGWAIHFGLTRSDLFSSIGAHSPVIFFSDWRHISEWLAIVPNGQMPRFYIDIAENDGEIQNARRLESILDAADVPHEWHLYTGFHNETYWSAHVVEYLRWYAAGWQ